MTPATSRPPRRQFLYRLAALAALPWLSGCRGAQNLTVAIHPWIGYEPLFLARDFAWLPPDIRLLEGKNLSDSATALQDGRADAACMTLDEVLRLRSEGLPLAVGLVFDVSAGGDVVLGRPGMTQPADLANKRIGFENNALGVLILDQVLAAAQLPLSAVKIVDLPPDRQLEAWDRGEVDAVITYEPVVTLLQRQGAQRLFDSRQMPDMIFDVLALRTDRSADRHDLMHQLLEQHFRALDYLRNNRQDALFRIATHEGVSPDEVRLALAGIHLPSLIANRHYLATKGSRLLAAAEKLGRLMRSRDLLNKDDDYGQLLAANWLPIEDH